MVTHNLNSDLPLLEHMHKKFEINRTKIKVSCQSGRKVVTHDSKSDLPLIPMSLIFFCDLKMYSVYLCIFLYVSVTSNFTIVAYNTLDILVAFLVYETKLLLSSQCGRPILVEIWHA